MTVPARQAQARAPAHELILLTGFEPFGGDPSNPSMQVVQRLHGQRVSLGQGRPWLIQSLVLPCVFDQAIVALQAALRQHRPRLALSVGLAADRQALSFERVAINWIDARIPDNAGAWPIDVPVLRQTRRAAYMTTLPVKAMAHAAQSAGVPAELSLSAGTYVCNAVMFALLHEAARLRRDGVDIRAGFCHVPRASTLPLQAMEQGLMAALVAAANTRRDRREAGGTLA